MKIISANPSMQDLQLKIHESTLVFPSQQTQQRSLFLSNLDHFLNFNIQTVYFFRANLDFSLQIVTKRLKMAIGKVMVPYDFMAGRLKWNHQLSRLEIDCNAAGAGFVVASSDFSLDGLGDLVCPNPAFRQLAVDTLNDLDHDQLQPLCVFQVTSFQCGGFAIGMSNNHILLDGLAAKMFRDNLASQAFDDKSLASIPLNDRRLLSSTGPPPVISPPPEQDHQIDFKVLKLSSTDINSLKAKAAEELVISTTTKKITTFSVVAALIWHCRALPSQKCKDDGMSNIIIAMDLRLRLKPPLPPEYCGNAVGAAYVSARFEDVENGPFSKVVEMVSEGISRASDEYDGFSVDWSEISKRVVSGDCLLSSWLRLGLDEVVFPWGKALHFAPLVNPMQLGFVMMPDADDDGGVNVLCAQPADMMETLQIQFHNFFAHHISS